MRPSEVETLPWWGLGIHARFPSGIDGLFRPNAKGLVRL